jgi:type VI protein secretion system component VasK
VSDDDVTAWILVIALIGLGLVALGLVERWKRRRK